MQNQGGFVTGVLHDLSGICRPKHPLFPSSSAALWEVSYTYVQVYFLQKATHGPAVVARFKALKQGLSGATGARLEAGSIEKGLIWKGPGFLLSHPTTWTQDAGTSNLSSPYHRPARPMGT